MNTYTAQIQFVNYNNQPVAPSYVAERSVLVSYDDYKRLVSLLTAQQLSDIGFTCHAVTVSDSNF